MVISALSGHRLGKLCFLLLAGLLLSACSTPYPARVNDYNAPLYVASVTIRPESWRNRNPERGGAGIEFEYEHQSGEGKQTIVTPDYLQLEPSYGIPVVLNGTQTVHNLSTADHSHIAFNYLFRFGDHFQLEPSVGVAYDTMKLHVYDAVNTSLVDVQRNYAGVTAAIVPRWQFNDNFALEGHIRYGIGRGFTISGGPSFVYSPNSHLSLTLGYAWREQSFSGKGGHYSVIDGTIDTHATSDIELNYNGANMGLRLNF